MSGGNSSTPAARAPPAKPVRPAQRADMHRYALHCSSSRSAPVPLLGDVDAWTRGRGASADKPILSLDNQTMTPAGSLPFVYPEVALRDRLTTRRFRTAAPLVTAEEARRARRVRRDSQRAATRLASLPAWPLSRSRQDQAPSIRFRRRESVLPGSPLGSSTRPSNRRPSAVSTSTLPIQRAG